jgi:hypothetical protein
LKRASGPRLQERQKEWPRKKKWVRSWFLYFFKVLMYVHHEETVVSCTGAVGRTAVVSGSKWFSPLLQINAEREQRRRAARIIGEEYFSLILFDRR